MTRRFFYHALGAGLRGRITRPCCELIDAQATTALPSVGGYASNRVDAYRFRDIVSVRSARAYAVVEMAAGSAKRHGVQLGDRLYVSPEGI